jgi:hypothetical protein
MRPRFNSKSCIILLLAILRETPPFTKIVMRSRRRKLIFKILCNILKIALGQQEKTREVRIYMSVRWREIDLKWSRSLNKMPIPASRILATMKLTKASASKL